MPPVPASGQRRGNDIVVTREATHFVFGDWYGRRKRCTDVRMGLRFQTLQQQWGQRYRGSGARSVNVESG